jgi:hypothetical protein
LLSKLGQTPPSAPFLPRGIVIRRAPPSVEAGIVLGPSPHGTDVVLVAHGWIDSRPDAGLFSLTTASWEAGNWRTATPEEAEAVRALFLAHAEAWGPTSVAWVARERTEAREGGAA